MITMENSVLGVFVISWELVQKLLISKRAISSLFGQRPKIVTNALSEAM